MAMFDPAVDSVEDVLAIRTRAMTLLKEGTAMMSWSSEGTSVTKQFTLPVDQVLMETLEFLRTADPVTYGVKIKRMRGYYI